VLREWFKRKDARRRAELEARAPRVREEALEVMRRVAAPLVEAGHARLTWTPPDREDEWLEDGRADLVPAKDEAAAVQVFPEPALVTLLVGPRGHAHEIVVDVEGEWREEFRACLEAVVNGRYSESSSPGRLSRTVLTMTFDIPQGNDIVVKHHVLFEPDPGEEEDAPADRRFPSYGN
jgi:hypothetical protein